MTRQIVIDRINDAVIALANQKDLLMRGNADRPSSIDIEDVAGRARLICAALDTICEEYGVDDSNFSYVAGDVDFVRAGEEADERRLRAPK